MPDIQDSAKSSNAISVALIVPSATRRLALETALAGSQLTLSDEFDTYPSPEDLPKIVRLDCDAIIVDLDEDVEAAIGVIQNICSHNVAMAVIAYSSRNDPYLLRRCMQAGARGFLTEAFLPETVSDAFR